MSLADLPERPAMDGAGVGHAGGTSAAARTSQERAVATWLLLANVVLAVGLVLMAVVTLQLSRQAFEDRATVNAENLANTLQQSVASSMERLDLSINVMRLAYAARSGKGAVEPSEINAVLSRLDSLLGPDLHMRIADAEGWVRYGQDLPDRHLVNVGDRPYFAKARDTREPLLFMAEPVQSRVNGKWVLPVVRRLDDAQGRFAGIVYVSVELVHFQGMFRAVDVGRSGAISLRHADGLQLIARQTERGPSVDGIGTGTVSAQLRDMLKASPRRGNYVAKTALDQIERANAYVRVEPYPLVVLVGLAVDDVLAPWYFQRIQIFGLVLLVMVLMAVASVLAYRHWHNEAANSRAAALANQRQQAAEREAELLRAQVEQRDEFVRVLAHEVRQPLNNASAALQSARAALMDRPALCGDGTTQTGSAAAERVRRAETVIGQIVGTLDNTLAISSMLATLDRVQGGDADVALLIELSIGDLDVGARSRVQVERHSATRTAWMDIGLMRLALRNVLGNALVYSPADRPVRLRVSDSDEPLGLVFEVLDEGIGVSDELRPRLFQRGSRGTHNVSGHGIGLYVVHRVMELHGGAVDVRHNEPVGTVFRLWLPQDR